MKSKKPCKHKYANFKIRCEGEDDCIVVKCVLCGKQEDGVFIDFCGYNFPIKVIEKLKDKGGLVVNQNIINTQEFFENQD